MLSDVFPRPVRLTLAGRAYKVHALRVMDLAYLERWATGGVRAIYDCLSLAESEPDADTRHELLREAYRHARDHGNDFGSDAVNARLASIEGRVVVLWLALRRGQRFRQVDAVALAEKLTAAEWLAVERHAWGVDPLDAAAAAIDSEIGAKWDIPRTAEKGDWSEAVACVARQFGGFAAVGRMTLAQWDAARRVTEAPAEKLKREHPIAFPKVPPNEQNIAASRLRSVFWATSDDAEGDHPDAHPGVETNPDDG